MESGGAISASPPPSFAAIIVTAARPHYLRESLASVLEQSRPPDEIIVVLDGEDPETVAILEKAGKRVTWYIVPNRGVSVARNFGVSRSSSDWVSFLDDDDIWHRDKLKITAKYLHDHPACQAVRNPVWFFTEGDPSTTQRYGFRADFSATNRQECHVQAEVATPVNASAYLEIDGRSYNQLLVHNAGILSATVLRRDLFITAGGFPPAAVMADDWTLFLNVARLTEWQLIDHRLGFTRLHDAQSSGDPEAAMMIASARVFAMFGGRVEPARRGGPGRPLLSLLAEPLANEFRGFVWSALRAHSWQTARRLWLMSGVFLSPRHRVKVLAPPGLRSWLRGQVRR